MYLTSDQVAEEMASLVAAHRFGLNVPNLNLLILNVNIKRGRVELYSPRWKILGGSRQKGYKKRSLQITEHSKHSAGEK